MGERVKKHASTIAAIIAGWNAFGFFLGLLNTMYQRDSSHFEDKPGGGHLYVSDNLSGCVYKSLSSFTNPGYVLACELFRKRFEYEGVLKVLNK